MEREDLAERCRLLFASHRRTAFGGSFHVPDITTYPELFSWDSGYHALALAELDAELAVEELSTLYRANQTDDGLLAHERPLPEAHERVRFITKAFGSFFRASGPSFLIDPPVAAFAAAKLGASLPATVLSDVVRHLDAIAEHRVSSDLGLPVVLHPFETGTEGTPLTDSLVDVSSAQAYLACLKSQMETALTSSFDVEDARRAGHAFVVADPVFCSWYLLALEEVSRVLRERDDAATAERMDARSRQTAEAIERHLWWDEEEIVAGYDVRGMRPLRVITAAGVIVAASRSFPEALRTRILDRHLASNSKTLWGPYGISFNPVDPAASRSGFWRGNVVWGATVYWSHLALVRDGRLSRAQQARTELEQLIEREGFREHYDAVTGRGGGAGAEHGFTWPTLVLAMRANEDASTS